MAERYHHGDLRGALLAALRPLVERDGPQGFSVAEAARAAGVSSGAPYRHFKDRGAILAALSLDMTDRLAARLVADMEEREGAARVEALCLGYVAFARAEPALFRLSLGQTMFPETPDGTASGRAVFDLAESAVAGALGVPLGSAEAGMAAFGLWCTVHGLALVAVDGKAGEIGLPLDVEATVSEAVRRWLA